MSDFIIPLTGLPSITSLTEQQKTGAAKALESAPFSDFLKTAVSNLNETNQASRDTMYDLAVGDTDDLHTGAIAAVKYSTAVSFASGVTNSVVRAYNELLRMSI